MNQVRFVRYCLGAVLFFMAIMVWSQTGSPDQLAFALIGWVVFLHNAIAMFREAGCTT